MACGGGLWRWLMVIGDSEVGDYSVYDLKYVLIQSYQIFKYGLVDS